MTQFLHQREPRIVLTVKRTVLLAPTYIQWRRVMRQYESLFFPIQFLHQRKLRLDDSVGERYTMLRLQLGAFLEQRTISAKLVRREVILRQKRLHPNSEFQRTPPSFSDKSKV